MCCQRSRSLIGCLLAGVVRLCHATEYCVVSANLGGNLKKFWFFHEIWNKPADLRTVFFVFSLCVTHLIKLGLEREEIFEKKIKFLNFQNSPSTPTSIRRTRQRIVACGVKLLEHQLVLAVNKFQIRFHIHHI